MRSAKQRLAVSAVLATLTAPLALVTLGAGPASAEPFCEVPDPPPICGGDPSPDPPPVKPTRGDFDGDGKADLTVYRPYNASWYTIGSKTGQPLATVWFGRLDAEVNLPAPGRFDSDARADHGVLSRFVGVTPAYSLGKFSYRSSVTGTGAPASGPDTAFTSSPVIADYNGDGRDDMADIDFGMTWSVPGFPDRVWGVQGDWAVPGDYDKDKKADLAVWRPSNGTWYVIKSSTGAVTTQHWGQQGDVPVHGDYDKDGKTDFAVWRPSNGKWYVINSSTGGSWSFTWGEPNDRPVPLDYTGDKKTDLAVWRPSNGTWYIWPNGAASGYSRQWGVSGDVPIR